MDNVVDHPSSNLQQLIVVTLGYVNNKLLDVTNHPYLNEENVDNVLIFNKEGNTQCVNKL